MNKKSLKLFSAKEVMEEMGFDKNAPASTQNAFFRYLIKSAGARYDFSNVSHLRPFTEKNENQPSVSDDTQLDLFKKAS